MPEHVVYLLGAGFSAQLGLPVMPNFVSKSKDQYLGNPSRFKHFQPVFELFDHLAKIKATYSSDLSNIEEILSILSIGQFGPAPANKQQFIDYLCDVIEHHTPDVGPVDPSPPSNWRHVAFGRDKANNEYGNFVLALTRRGLRYDAASGQWSSAGPDGHAPTYSVVTLNYDTVIEGLHKFASDNLSVRVPLRINEVRPTSDGYVVPLAKLHGSVADRLIIPPTWSKGADTLPESAWQLGLKELGRANYIRVIGYSLPESDLNIRYLLKAAALDSFHLKRIDVLCLDPKGHVKARYDAFLTHPGYRFLKANVALYFGNLAAALNQAPTANCATVLENIHAGLFDQVAT